MIGVAILGSTGSIGESTLEFLSLHRERFEVVALGARSSVQKLAAQVRRWKPRYAVLAEPEAAGELARELARTGESTEVLAGEASLAAIARSPEAPYVMAAIVGGAGLSSTLAAAASGKRLMLANKESLVMAAPLVIEAARASGATLLPIDSEHNAIFQCLPPGTAAGSTPPGVRRILLTASGGPFLDWPAGQLATVTPEQACAHPNWVMGRKISVDSATLMNKGLELIEACHLFGVRPDQVEVVVHRQSIVHSMVEYIDGSVLAQLGSPDMRTPIAHAFAWPERLRSGVDSLDLIGRSRLDFCAPDTGRFQCLALAQAAARAGGSLPVALNASNEIAVQAFLDGQLNFQDIAGVIEAVMTAMNGGALTTLDDVLAADREARERARRHLSRPGARSICA